MLVVLAHFLDAGEHAIEVLTVEEHLLIRLPLTPQELWPSPCAADAHFMPLFASHRDTHHAA